MGSRWRTFPRFWGEAIPSAVQPAGRWQDDRDFAAGDRLFPIAVYFTADLFPIFLIPDEWQQGAGGVFLVIVGEQLTETAYGLFAVRPFG